MSDLLGMGVGGVADAMRGCDAVVSCLGHRLTLEGVYGGGIVPFTQPRFSAQLIGLTERECVLLRAVDWWIRV